MRVPFRNTACGRKVKRVSSTKSGLWTYFTYAPKREQAFNKVILCVLPIIAN